MWNAVSGNPLSEALHLGWKLRLLLRVKVTQVLQARVEYSVLTDISNSKFSEKAVLLENEVSQHYVFLLIDKNSFHGSNPSR